MMFQAMPLMAVGPELQIGALILGLAIAVIFHEVAHGWVALKLGDPTAYYAGRLTLNPIKHVDLFGTILLPLMLIMLGTLTGGRSFLFGWAKPVPVNYYNLRYGKYGPVIVALAGPATNLLLLLIAGLLARVSPTTTALPYLFGVISLVNGWLMMFNLLPIPPLDGSKVLYIFLERRPDIIAMLEQYSIYIMIGVLMFGGSLLQLLVLPTLYLVGLAAGTDVLFGVLGNLP